ncbi:hypothetical protein TTHERM_00527310 (macronuclear) [Tetrahymena thermophila SB210]|uniref:Tetratricopeptide repeat protein n=1 Tax=Tetrahymena thermophila (strain SB210) TaxID=312017 RepID=I7MB91_TETTS|nr:hypothetical protein TTHERM_00527310 [Tetrahymena thermophila SB210]EAS07894.2 hypothetical protein TTHERM_00527310 [Tetrahymena thermophila SB210]|eukprot:XP_001028136.2 hypothetical protein TTHERM_00527310 [Tetrahymena thermophila SB210]
MIQKVCFSPWCEDTDRIIIEQQINQISLHKQDESYIVRFSDIIEKKQSFLDVFSKFKKKLSDFTYLLLTTQSSLQKFQIYQKNQNDIHHFMIKQCLKISQYYQSFDRDFIEMKVINLIRQYDSDKENKKSILMQINQIISIDHILEKRVFEKVMDQFKLYFNSDEIKSFNDENMEQFKIYFEQKCSQIIEMRSELISNLLQEYIQLNQDSNTNQYCLKYLQKLTIICNQEQQVLKYLQNLNQKQNYSRELKLLEDFKSKLIESLLFLVDSFSSQYDIQSTFQCFYEVYSLEIYNKDIFDLMIKTLKKFDLNYQERSVQTLGLLTFSKDKEILEEFIDKLFPTFQNKNNLVDKIQQLSDQPDQKKIFYELQKVFQNELNDQQLSSLLQQLLNSNCINLLIQTFFLSFLSLYKNNYFIKGIPSEKILNDSINIKDIFSYTLQKQAERKEKNLQKEIEKKKLEQEKALERKNRRNNQEKKFENFRQLAKQRRNLLGFLLQTDSTQSNSQQETIEQISKNSQDEKHSIDHILENTQQEHEHQINCIQNSLFLVSKQIISDSQLIDQSQQNCQNDNKIQDAMNEENESQDIQYKQEDLKSQNKQNNELCNENKNQFKKIKQSKKIKKQKQIVKKEFEIDSFQDSQLEQLKCQQELQVQFALPKYQIKKIELQQIEVQDISKNGKVQDSLQNQVKEEDETYSMENLCKNLCEDPFDQESFLRLFNSLNEEQLVELCKRYKQIMTQTLSKKEMNSQLMSFFSASCYFHLDKLQLSKLFLEKQLKFNFNDPQRLNQLGFIQFFNKQADCSIQNFINSIKLSQNRSQWFIHAQLGFLFQYIFENNRKALYHYQVSMNLKFVQLSFFLLFQVGYIYYHNLNDYNMALILFKQGFQFIKNNNLFESISSQYLTQLILDYSLLNYRIGNLEISKYLLNNFFEQNPIENLDVASYLNALINFKLDDYQSALNQLQIISECQNLSIKIECHILRGFIYMYHVQDTNQSKQQYQQAWEILCNNQVQNKLQKQIRVLKKLIFLNNGIGFYHEREQIFVINLSRNAFISYLEFLFDFAVQKYNEYINLIIFYYQEQQTDIFNTDFIKNQLDCKSLIQLFQECYNHNYRKIECMYMIGKCYYDLLGQEQQSLQCFSLVLKLDPFHCKSMLQTLNLLVNSQNYEQAIIILQQIENLQFQSPQKTYLKAKIFQAQGKYQLSQSLYLLLLNNQETQLSKNFNKLIQKDYSYCQYMIQENQISKYIK